MNHQTYDRVQALYREADPGQLAQLLGDAQKRYVRAHDTRNLLIAFAIADGWPTGWIADKVGLSRQRIEQFKAKEREL